MNNDITPKTSVGIIIYKLDKTIYDKFTNNLKNISYYDINNILFTNINPFNKLTEYFKYDENIKFLLVKRRNSLNYIDFMRGKYNIDDLKSIINMASYMSKEEIELLKNNKFDTLWHNLWLKNAYKKKYLNEMKKSNEMFDYLKSINFFDNLNSEYSCTEWEIPKGGKKQNETYINCAIRELEEETLLNKTNYKIIKCVDPIHDIFTGTDKKEYRHIFYTGLLTNNNIEDYNHSNNEIDCIKWCSWSEINNIIRPYNNSKIKILTLLFFFIINICNYNNTESLINI
jgi:ADP-ribose pyrophosphatase YjhB (NUDIX family)